MQSADYFKNYYEKNKEKIRAYQKVYAAAHRRKGIEANKRWRKTPMGREKHKLGSARRRKRNQDYVNKVKAAPCMDCGISYPPYVMDLHHRDPSTKYKAVATMVPQGCSIKRIQAEIDKCDLICSNCHRIRHYG